ncbi:MAG: DUF937 domain-containing protein [Povalibacter sp.]
MNVDLLEIFQSALGAGLIRDVSSQLGESELSTRSALQCAAPALMSGLMQRVVSPGGAAEVFRQVTDSEIDAGAAGKFPGLLASRDTLESLLRLGQSLDQKVFGARTAAVTHALAESSGVRTSSALTILSLTAPILFGLLKKHARNNDLDATALAVLLLHQQHAVGTSGLDHRVAGALGFGSVAEMLAALPSTPSGASSAKAVRRVSERSWLPWSAAAAVGVFGVLFLVNQTAEQQDLPHGAVKIAEMQPRDSAQAHESRKTSAEEPDPQTGVEDSREAARDRTRAVRDMEPSPAQAEEQVTERDSR